MEWRGIGGRGGVVRGEGSFTEGRRFRVEEAFVQSKQTELS